MTGVRKLQFILAFTLLLTLASGRQAEAATTCDAPLTCEFSTCRTPAKPAPASLWGELKPAEVAIPAERDSTDHTGKTQAYDGRNPMWFSVDIENNWIFTAHTSGFEIWNGSASAEAPAKMSAVDGRRNGFPRFPANPEMKFPVSDLDAPADDDSLLAVAALGGVGLTIWDTRDKGGAKALYQDFGSGREFDSVYAAKIGGATYAFAAGPGGGLRVYNMTAAQNFATACLDEAPANTCSGVFKGKIGTRTNVSYVSGVGNFVALSTGIAPKGVELWNVANINAPTLVGTWASADFAYGTAMWTENNGTSMYLAVRAGSPEALRIYDVSCAISGPCTPGAPVSTTSLGSPGTSKYFVTFSRSGATPFLYLGGESLCAGEARMEWVFDVSVPGAPRDITPPDGIADGVPTGYWQWYSRLTATGFNWVAPRRAKFNNEFLYRAAVGIFDIHKLGSAKPNPAFVSSPTQVFVGTPVSFTDQTSGNPSSWGWTFEGGSPASSFIQNPTGVTFGTTGVKTVTLQACNAFGCNSTSQVITVVDPQAAVTGLTVSPGTLTSCVSATFTATGVTGKAPLSYAWTFSPVGATAPTTIACTTNPCTYVVPSDLVDGTYEATVKVTNAENPTGATAVKQVTLDQQVLGFVVASPSSDPTTTGTVKFHILSTGAKEWSWDFGTGSGFGAYSADPVTGPNPTNTYTITGNYSIRVKIRDCNGVELTSSPLNLSVTAIPLVADFTATCFFGQCAFDSGTAIAFTDASTGTPETWSYDWNHSGTSSATCNFTSTGTSPQTSHTYTSAGTYQPCLRVTRGPDSNVVVHAKAIQVATPAPPKVTLSGTSSGTVNNPYTFSASATNCSPSSNGWRWSIGGGSGSSTTSSISITWSTTGTKSVSVSNTSCGSASASKSVSISSGTSGSALTANYTYSPTTISAGQAVSFDGRSSSGSPTIYQWTFGDGTPTADGSQVQHTFANGGTFQVTLSIAKPGTGAGCSLGFCTDTETKTIVVSGEPIVPLVAAFTYSPETIKAGKPVSFDGSGSQGTPTVYEWTFGDGSPKGSGAQAQHTYANPGTYQVKLSVGKPGSGAGCSLGVCTDDEVKTITVEPAQTGVCEDDPMALCLNDGRFKVQTTWKQPGETGKSGRGQPIGISDDTGYFWFEYDSNVEVVVKVLDGCSVNGYHWVFATGLTNIEVVMTVLDKQTGAIKTYTNPQGVAFDPIQDTKAFSCTGESLTAESFEFPSYEDPVEWVEVREGDPIPTDKPYVLTTHSDAEANTTCTATETALCLNGGRFRVEAWWQTADGLGTGQAVALGADTGYFWFFNKDNVELIIKVLDGCALNSRYWVFAGGLTNVGVRIIVTDTVRGDIKQYENPMGTAFQPQQDTDAIDECF